MCFLYFKTFKGATRGGCTSPNGGEREGDINSGVGIPEHDNENAIEIENEADFDDYVPPEALMSQKDNDASALSGEVKIKNLMILFG